MKPKILRHPHSILAAVATEVESVAEAEPIIRRLMLAMRSVGWGKAAGMAAPQIGISKRVFMIGPEAFINPVVLSQYDFYETREGCYSLKPNYFEYLVERPAKIVLAWTNVNGERREEKFTGYKAQVIHHEFEHLQGKCLVAA